MKKKYLLLALFATNLIISQNFQDTKGELSVSGSGTASYKVPIALPPGIKDVAPQLALVYNGSSVQGMAGMGWNLVGVSSITRISSRLDLDNVIDAVDFDNLDRFALDGQRLIEKVGVYGVGGTTYQIENYSNLKIESAGSFVYPGLTNPTGPQSFIVTFPDGSQAFYGGTADSRGLMEWMINRWIDPQGNYIDYTYETENNTIRIKKISWGKNTNSASTYENLIEFTYKDRIRAEYSYLNGIKISATKILNFVTVKTGGVLFRTYTLEHETISGNYQRVKKVTESNGIGETANPVVFDYNTTAEGFGQFSYYKSPTDSYLDKVKVSGDFDGDGNVDFVTNDKLYLNPINNSNVWSGINFTIGEKNHFTATTLTNNKLNQFQSIVKTEETATAVNFNVYNLSANTLGLSYTKTINFDNNVVLGAGTTNTYYDYYINTYSDNCIEPNIKQSNKYLEGDFNGDGISELLIVKRKNETYHKNEIIYSNWNGGDGYSCETSIQDEGEEWYLLDLNTNASNVIGSNGFVKLQISNIAVGNVGLLYSPNSVNLDENKKTIADFNGDGKLDILVINPFRYRRFNRTR